MPGKKTVDLWEFIGGDKALGTTVSLQKVSQDLFDLTKMQKAISEAREEVVKENDGNNLNLDLALDILEASRMAVAQALTGLVLWAKERGTSTIVDLVDTEVQCERVNLDETDLPTLAPTTKAPKGLN